MARLSRIGWLVAATMMAAPAALAQPEDGRYYGPHMWDGGWWMFLGPLWMIVVVGAIVAVVVLLARWLGGTGHPAAHTQHQGKSPIDILKERFARGEVDREEFEERRKLLE